MVVGVTGIEESGDGEESATEDTAIPLGRGDNDIDAMLDEPVQRAVPPRFPVLENDYRDGPGVAVSRHHLGPKAGRRIVEVEEWIRA